MLEFVMNEDSVSFESHSSCLSNYYPAPMTLADGTVVDNAWLYFIHLAAQYYDDKAMMMMVRMKNSQLDIARILHELDNHGYENWLMVRKALMYITVKDKFLKYVEMRYALLATIKKKVIISCGDNRTWDCGLLLADSKHIHEYNWTGENLYGKTLARLRDVLIENGEA